MGCLYMISAHNTPHLVEALRKGAELLIHALTHSHMPRKMLVFFYIISYLYMIYAHNTTHLVEALRKGPKLLVHALAQRPLHQPRNVTLAVGAGNGGSGAARLQRYDARLAEIVVRHLEVPAGAVRYVP